MIEQRAGIENKMGGAPFYGTAYQENYSGIANSVPSITFCKIEFNWYSTSLLSCSSNENQAIIKWFFVSIPQYIPAG